MVNLSANYSDFKPVLCTVIHHIKPIVMKHTKFILNLNEVGIDNIDIVGGKNASLGEMIQHLTQLNIRIPGGYIITVAAYKEYIAYNLLEEQIKSIIGATDLDDLDALRRCGQKVRRMVAAGIFPPALTEQITNAYHKLSAIYKQDNVDVAVRSSATAEDLPDASFAGQQETFLNVSGIDGLLDAVRNCFASLFTDRAISYRESFKYDHFDIGLSVCVQKW